MNTMFNSDKLTTEIVNNIQVGLHIYHLEKINDDRTLRMLFANKASETFTGVSSKKLTGKTLDEIFPGLREKGIPQKYAEVVRSQVPIELEDIYYGDHQVVVGWFAVKSFPLPNNCVAVSFDNITGKKNAELAKEEVIKNLRQALDEIKSLRSILPLCSFCKKIRDDKGYWEQVDTYIHKHLQADISHGICPECSEKNYPEYSTSSSEKETE